MLVVCAAIIHRNDKILIAQRKEKSHMEFKWEFPGGKVEEGEDPVDCIAREIKEELNISIKADNVFDVVYHSYPDKNIILLVYNCNYISGETMSIDCNDFKWINVDELRNFDLAPADIKIANKLLGN